MPNKRQKNAAKTSPVRGRGSPVRGRGSPVRGRGRRSARLEDSAAPKPTPRRSPSDEEDAASKTSRGSSEASIAACVASNSPPQALSKKRAKKTPFCLDFHEEQLMCDFLRENTILWDIKKTDYRRVDKKAKLWEDKANIMGKSVPHLQGWFNSLRDTHTRLHKNKSGNGPHEMTEREHWVKASFGFLKSVVRHRAEPIKSVKETIAAHSGDLEAAEAACAHLMALEDRSPSPVPYPYRTSKAKGKRGHDDDELFQSLQKRVHESGELLKELAQPQPITVNVAYANYMRDILLCMSKTKFRKAMSSINEIVKVLLDEDSDPEEVPTAYTVPARAPVRSTTGTEKQQELQSQDQQQQAQYQPMMPPPPHHGYKQTPRVSTEQPSSASSSAVIGSAARETNSSQSDLETSSQSFCNISGFSSLLNLSCDAIATSTPCVQQYQPDPLQNYK